jgi:hypothetical protein
MYNAYVKKGGLQGFAFFIYLFLDRCSYIPGILWIEPVQPASQGFKAFKRLIEGDK